MSQIRQISSNDVSTFLNKYSGCTLLDVRTKEEWEKLGKPDGEKLGATTCFLSIKIGEERKLNENFIKEFQKKTINKNQPLLIICASGVRSNFSAELLSKAGYSNCINIADGFEGRQDFGIGWKINGLPCK